MAEPEGVYEDPDTDEELLPSTKKPSLFQRYRSSSHVIAPIIFVAYLAEGFMVVIIPQFIQHHVEIRYGVESTTDSNTLCAVYKNRTISTNQTELAKRISQESSFWTLALFFAYLAPAIFVTVLLSSWSDHVGRRCIAIIGCLDFMALILVGILMEYLKFSLELLIGLAFIVGLAGSHLTLSSACYASAADLSSKEQRTFGLVVLMLFSFLAFGSSQLMSGYLLVWFNFASILWVILIMYVLCLIYVAIFLTDKTLASQEDIKMFREHLFSMFRKRQNSDHIKLALLLLTTFLYHLTDRTDAVYVLFVENIPFCWNPVMIGYYFGALSIIGGVGMFLAFVLLSSCASENFLIQLGFLSAFANQITRAVATTSAGQFSSALSGIVRLLPLPLLQSAATKLTNGSEYGTLFGIFFFLTGLGQVISPLVMGGLYTVTIPILPNFVFYVAALISVAPILLIGIIQFMSRDDPERTAIA